MMADSNDIFLHLLNAVQELTRSLERDFDYRQQQAEKAKAEPVIYRELENRNLATLAAANAVAANVTDWGQSSRRGQRREAAGQLNFADRPAPTNMPPDSGRAETSPRSLPDNRPPDSEDRTGLPTPDLRTGFARGLRGERPGGPEPTATPGTPLRTFAEDLRDQPLAKDVALSDVQRFRRDYSNTSGNYFRRLRAGLRAAAHPDNLPPVRDPEATHWQDDTGKWHQRPDPYGGGGDNRPPDSGGADVGGSSGDDSEPSPQPGGRGPGGPAAQRQRTGPFNTDQETGQALTWAMLGEHGGPKAIRNMYLESWGLQQSLRWGAQNVSGLQDRLGDPKSMTNRMVGKVPGLDRVLNKDALGPVEHALGFAAEHPIASYLTYAGIRGVGNRFGDLRNYQAMGQQLGYGGPTLGGQSVFGFHNPLGDFGQAAQVGAAYTAEEQALMGRIPGMGFGTGLSHQQAQEDVSSLAQQGFGMQPIGSSVGGAALSAVSTIPVIGGPLAAAGSALAGAASHLPLIGGAIGSTVGHGLRGDTATIAQNLDRPLQTRFPGLSGGDINQFTPALRYSGTSIQQLTDQLHNLGGEAHASRETVGQFASSLHEAAQGFQGLGSTMQGGVAVGTGFSNVTGMDPRVASQAAQNPLFQGMAMSHYGILPSGLGDMSSGAFTSNTLQTLQMLQHGLSGLNQTRFQTINGVRLPVAQGQQQMYDQIAQMTGMDANQVKYMLRDQNRIQARATAQQTIGDPTSNTGLWSLVNQGQRNPDHRLNKQQYNMVNQDWQRAVVPYLKQSGVSQKEINRLDHMSGMRNRLTAAAGDINNQTNNDPYNQIQNRPNANTVQVQFTPLAAKYFQQVPTSPAKAAANAGGPSYGSIANSIPGDISGGAWNPGATGYWNPSQNQAWNPGGNG